MISKVFGELNYDYLWEGEIDICSYNKIVKVKIDINDEDEKGITKLQDESFIKFKEREVELDCLIQNAIFSYYKNIIKNEEYIDTYLIDSIAEIKQPYEMSELVKLQQLCIPEIEEDREIILLFTCKWNYEHGLGVKIVNEKIVKVGIQEEVLI